MMHDYTIDAWEGLNEEFILECIQICFEKLFYEVINFHKNDRIHEEGIDLLCTKDKENIAIQFKKKPKKSDIDQFKKFINNTNDIKKIYVYLEKPTRPFKKYLDINKGNIEIWDNYKLHQFLVENESKEYLCLYLSSHNLIKSIQEVYLEIVKKIHTEYKNHNITNDEISLLWIIKDNAVKIKIPLYFIFMKWRDSLIIKKDKDKSKFNEILDNILSDIDMAYDIVGNKLISSFKDLSNKHPDIIRLLWIVASKSSSWNEFTSTIDRLNNEKGENFIKYEWTCPLQNNRVMAKIMGFYSSMIYLLEHFFELGQDLENAIDWVFSEMIKSKS